MKTYWLYYHGDPIYAVRMPETTSAQDVRLRAMAQNDLVPLCYPEAPGTFRIKLFYSEVRSHAA